MQKLILQCRKYITFVTFCANFINQESGTDNIGLGFSAILWTAISLFEREKQEAIYMYANGAM
jgi:hypothetical protein